MAQISHLWWLIGFHVWKRVCQWQAQQILRFCASQGCEQGLKCSPPQPPQLGPLARPGGTCYSWQGPKPFGEVYIYHSQSLLGVLPECPSQGPRGETLAGSTHTSP